MEPDGDLEELARLRSVFAACDANRSGRLEREEFSALCAELRVRPADAEAVFQRLDADHDGAITFQEFARGFRGAHRGRRRWGRGPREPAFTAALVGSDPGDNQEDEGDEDAAAAALAAHWDSASPGQAWQDFQARLGDEVKFIPRCVCGLQRGRWWWCFCPPWDAAISPSYTRSVQTQWTLSLSVSLSRFPPFTDALLTLPRRDTLELRKRKAFRVTVRGESFTCLFLSFISQSEIHSVRRFFRDAGLGALPEPQRLDYITSYSWPPGCTRSSNAW